MKIAAHVALTHLESAADHYQALQTLDIPEHIKRIAITATRVNLSMADEVRKAAKIKDEQPEVFKPAFHKTEWKHL